MTAVTVRDAVLRFDGQPRGRRMDASAALAALLMKGYRRIDMTRYHVLANGSGEECTWRYVHDDTGRHATLRIFYTDTED